MERAGPGAAAPGLALNGSPGAGGTGSGGAPMVVAVPVANVWSAPEAVREVDAPATYPCPDIPGWLAGMTHEDRLGLEGRLETQALLGEPVVACRERPGWVEVRLPDQPSRKSPIGYPGWVRSEHLVEEQHVVPAAPPAPLATVSRLLVHARTEAGVEVALSYGVTLAIEARRSGGQPGTGDEDVDGRAGADREVLLRLPSGDVVEVPADALAPLAPAGPAILASARRFSGLPYLWGGRSGYGVDCSGLAHLAHRCAGVVVPRDADDQAAAGTPVPLAPAAGAGPGDLVFFARPGEEPHHVALCAGEGRILHSPRTGRPVEEISLSTEPYASELVPTARRYAPTSPEDG